MQTRSGLGFVAVVALVASVTPANAADSTQVARGKYLVTIGGCNDCHTTGFMEQNLKIPEKDWLKGSAVGFQGPWGTTYPANLRRVVAGLTETQWLQHARQERLPPMPWFNVAKMTDADLKAIYAYIRSLGAPGSPAPAYVAPGGKVTTPYFVFVPQVDKTQIAAR